MFHYTTQIYLNNTDATGVLYFSEQFKIALQAFEAFLKQKGHSLKELIDSPHLIPIVHAEADYLAPLEVGDEIEVVIRQIELGASSITVHYSLFRLESRQEVGAVKIVHVAVDRKTRGKIAIPDSLRKALDCKASEFSEV